MKIIKPLLKGRIGITGAKPYKGKTHIDKDGRFTYCGVNHEGSETLGIPMDGQVEEVNCQRCLTKYEKEN